MYSELNKQNDREPVAAAEPVSTGAWRPPLLQDALDPVTPGDLALPGASFGNKPILR